MRADGSIGAKACGRAAGRHEMCGGGGGAAAMVAVVVVAGVRVNRKSETAVSTGKVCTEWFHRWVTLGELKRRKRKRKTQVETTDRQRKGNN